MKTKKLTYSILGLVLVAVASFLFTDTHVWRFVHANDAVASAGDFAELHVPASLLEKKIADPKPVIKTIRIETASSTSETIVVHDPLRLPGETAVRVPVLMYHYVRPWTADLSETGKRLSVTPERFELQMKDLVHAGYHTISPVELDNALTHGASLPSKPVLITFDDGYRDQFVYAAPILSRLKLKATFFIITQYDHYGEYMTDRMIQTLDASPLMTIASHTQHHIAVASVASSTSAIEIAASKTDLEKRLGHPIRYFAYPYGNLSPATEKQVEEAGYRLAFSTLSGTLHTPSSRFELRRVRVMNIEHLTNYFSRVFP